jgi:hypothetical protein
MNITVFGGASPQPGEEPYTQAYLLGRLLGQAGHTVLTGGYYGVMEAVSRGAAETGAHVIGVTCMEIENFKGVKPNAWVEEIRRREMLIERLTDLIHGCQAAIALPGGPGTLAEITLLWNLIIIQAVPARPLILVGAAWQSVFQEFLKAQAAYTPCSDGGLLTFAATVEEAADLIARYETG